MELNDVRTIVANLDDFLELPDGIERLRKAVLTLAVSGRLVPQDPKNGTGEDLYVKIQNERAKRSISKNGRGRKKEGLLSIDQTETPFEIPASWKWVRIRDVTHDCGQKIPQTDFVYVDVSAIDSSRGVITEPKYLEASNAPSRARKIVKNESVIYSSVRPYLLNTAIVDTSKYDKEVIASTAFFVLEPDHGVSSRYIHLLVRSPYFDKRVGQDCVGVAYPAINDDKFEKISIPLPPPDEQERIVKKVEAVMKQLDELEAKKKERDAVRARLTRSAMRTLGEGEDKLALEHLTELIRTPADLKELEMAVLTLAVSGKLVQQVVEEDSAESLYLQIQKERTEQKAARNDHTLELSEVPFDIPKSWKWVTLQEVFDVRDGTHDSPKYVAEGHPLVTSKNLSSGKLDLTNVKLISATDYTQISKRSCVSRGDLLFAMIGSIGNPVIVDVEPIFAIKNVALFKYYSPTLSEPNFLLLYLTLASHRMRELSGGGVQSFVSLGFLRKYPFPLPPLAEQRRIVKKVQELQQSLSELKRSV